MVSLQRYWYSSAYQERFIKIYPRPAKTSVLKVLTGNYVISNDNYQSLFQIKVVPFGLEPILSRYK